MYLPQVQEMLEKYLLIQWVHTVTITPDLPALPYDEVQPRTAIAFDNASFNSDLYTEYLRCNVLFGDTGSRTVTKGCYRQIGSMVLSVFTKPALGSARKLELVNFAADLLNDVVISPVAPLVCPRANFLEPSLHIDNNERHGWVMSQASCAFYYDFTSP